MNIGNCRCSFLSLTGRSLDKAFEQLRDPRAIHIIAGLDYLLREDVELTMEIYRKQYDFFPINPAQPSFFIIDEPFYDTIFYSVHEKLVDTGKAQAKGVELLLQKKPADQLYRLASVAYFRSSYQDYNGHWRDRTFDPRLLVSVEGGYKPNNTWEFSLHWIYSGGRP